MSLTLVSLLGRVSQQQKICSELGGEGDEKDDDGDHDNPRQERFHEAGNPGGKNKLKWSFVLVNEHEQR